MSQPSFEESQQSVPQRKFWPPRTLEGDWQFIAESKIKLAEYERKLAVGEIAAESDAIHRALHTAYPKLPCAKGKKCHLVQELGLDTSGYRIHMGELVQVKGPVMTPEKLAAFLKVNPQDPEVRMVLIGEFLHSLLPAQKSALRAAMQEMGEENGVAHFLATHTAQIDAFIQHRVAEIAFIVSKPGTPRDPAVRKYGL
jgi:hypothetical protein